MKKIVLTCIISIILVSLCGCAKCISVDTSIVEVKIVDEYHRGMYITPMPCGKSTIMITHPAVYRITIEYNGEKYDIDGKDIYEKYKDKIGEMANATLETKTYDDERVKYNIIELK